MPFNQDRDCKNSHQEPQDPDHGQLSQVEPVTGHGRIVDKDIRRLDPIHHEKEADGEQLRGDGEVQQDIFQIDSRGVAVSGNEKIELRCEGGAREDE